MGSRFISKFSLPLYLFTLILFIGSSKPAQALEECYNSIPVVLSGAVSDLSGIDWGTLTITVNGETPEGVFTNTLTGEWTATFSSAQVVEGTNVLAVSVIDDCGSGNYSSTTRSFRVDTIPPFVAITSPSNGSLLCTGSIVISGGYENGDSTCEERLDFWPWQPCGTGFPPIPDGPHTISIRVTDSCGNSATDSVSFIVDGAPPIVNITSPTNGATIYSSTVIVKGTASDSTSGLSLVCVSLDGGTCQIADLTGGNWSYTFNGVTNGPHTLIASAFDYCGYVGSDSVTFSVLVGTPGNVSITYPADGTTVCTNVIDVIVTALAMPGDDNLCLDIDSIEYLCVPLSIGPNTLVITNLDLWTISPGDGWKELQARIEPTGTTSTPVNIYVDTKPPNVAITSPTDGAYLNSTTVVVSGVADDGTGSGISAVLVNGYTASGTDSWIVTLTSNQYGNPIEVGFYDTLGSSEGVYVTGGYAYVCDGASGLAIIDVSDPANPSTPVYRDTSG
ncbi:MAG: hypothetical protein JSU92_04170, partial [Deltaproteobacteria bacterium]